MKAQRRPAPVPQATATPPIEVVVRHAKVTPEREAAAFDRIAELLLPFLDPPTRR